HILVVGFVWVAAIILYSLGALDFMGEPLKVVAVIFNFRYGLFFLVGINFYFIYKERAGYLSHLLIGLCFLAVFMFQKIEITIFFAFAVALFYLFVFEK